MGARKETNMEKQVYLEVTQEAGAAFFSKGITGPVVMLNLLRFKDVADYSDFPDLAPPEPISGREAYERYMTHSAPHLDAAGSEVLFSGSADRFLIGPQDERWDSVLLVKHASPLEFLAFAENEPYLAGMGHRIGALEDSRLLPIIEG